MGGVNPEVHLCFSELDKRPRNWIIQEMQRRLRLRLRSRMRLPGHYQKSSCVPSLGWHVDRRWVWPRPIGEGSWVAAGPLWDAYEWECQRGAVNQRIQQKTKYQEYQVRAKFAHSQFGKAQVVTRETWDKKFWIAWIEKAMVDIVRGIVDLICKGKNTTLRDTIVANGTEMKKQQRAAYCVLP